MTDILNTLIASNTLNFIIVVVIIAALIYKFKLYEKPEILANEIKTYVDESFKEKENAQNALNNAEELLKKLPKEIEDIKADLEAGLQNLREESVSETEKRKKDITGNAKRLFKLETKDFKQKLSNVLCEKSVELAKQNAINCLKDNKELHAKYIDEAIAQIDGIQL